MQLSTSTIDTSVDKSTRAPTSAILSARVTEYHARKAEGRCVQRGCDEMAADGANRCERHWTEQKARDKAWRAAQRKHWTKVGLCKRCGRKRRPDSDWGCRVCDSGPVDTSVDTKSARIAANTTARTTASNLGRIHYHGKGRRGACTKAECDARDLDEAIKRLVKAKALLEYARSPEVAQLPTFQRDEAMANFAAEAMLGVRHGLEIGVRHKQPVERYAAMAGKDE